MTDTNQNNPHEPQFIPFKAETRQLLDILIHSLYTDRDVLSVNSSPTPRMPSPASALNC